MLTEKAITICLLEILKEYSDDKHVLTTGEIISKLDHLYGLKPDRRTIYSAFDTLIGLGYEISLYKDNGKGYYLLDRLWSPRRLTCCRTQSVPSRSYPSVRPRT